MEKIIQFFQIIEFQHRKLLWIKMSQIIHELRNFAKGIRQQI